MDITDIIKDAAVNVLIDRARQRGWTYEDFLFHATTDGGKKELKEIEEELNRKAHPEG